MGMDFKMTIGHTMDYEEIQNFHLNEKLWKSIAEFFKTNLGYAPDDTYAKWTIEPTIEVLDKFWLDTMNEENDDYVEIDCYFGNIVILKHTLTFTFYTIFHSYKFFRQTESTKQIIKFGRLIANHLHSDKVLYLPDGYLNTSTLLTLVSDGKKMEEIIEIGSNYFGELPKGISKGRKNYFFVDYVNEEIGEIKEWDEEEDFWKWDEQKGDYVQISKLKK